jgi:hypothetical protein
LLLLYLPSHLISGYTSALDANVRLNPNDSYVGVYYFFWTNLTYLPSFFFILTFLLIDITDPRIKVYYWLFLPLFLFIYVTELSDFISLNLYGDLSSYALHGINNLLTNALNRYHPLVFYTSFILFITPLIPLSAPILTSAPFYLSHLLSSFAVYGWRVVVLNLVSLWMGSWWALQEGTWGGWWNWDSSEVFGLLISISLVSMLHTSTTLNSSYHSKLKYLWLSSSVLLSYFFIQLNFELASHNFGAKFFFFFNNNLFFLESAFVLIVVLILYSYLSVRIYSTYTLHKNRRTGHLSNYFPLLKLLPSFVVLYWVLWSYKPLFNYFFWNFLEVNVLNSESSLQPVNVTLLLILLLFFRTNVRPTVLPLLIASLLSVNWLWLLVLDYRKFTRVFVAHALLVIFTVLNITSCDLIINFWLTNTNYSYLKVSNILELSFDYSYSADSTTWEVSQPWANFTGYTSDIWNTYTLTNAPAVNFFSLELSQNFFQNIYNLGGVYSHSYLNLELPHIGTLNFITLSFLFTVSRLLTTANSPRIL